MKKILALTLAAVMAAGMSTVAFAYDKGDVNPVVGYIGGNDDGTAMPENNFLFKLNADGKATKVYDINEDVQLKGGDQIAIPIAIWEEGNGENDAYDNHANTTDKIEWYKSKNSYDYSKSVKVYFDEAEGDAEFDVKLVDYDVQADSQTAYDYGVDGRIWSVVITLPENDTNKVADLAGTIKVGTTPARARNAEQGYEINISYAPDGTNDNIVKKFDGDDTLDVGFTGIVAFEDDLGEIDIEFGDEAMFTVNVTGQGRLNLSWNTDHNKEFADMYSYANIDFLTFSGTPSFNRNGYLYIFAPEDAFIYGVSADGAVDVDAEWDEDYEAWRIRTRTLSSYAVSDVELDEKTVTEDKDDTTTDGGKVNPDTGR